MDIVRLPELQITKKRNGSETGSQSIFRWGGGTLLGSLDSANLN
jgi:hypothetical protein